MLQDCDCVEGCQRCQVVFKLDIRCKEDHYIVNSLDLRTSVENVWCLGDPRQDETERKITIVNMSRGQELKLVAMAYKSVAKEHAKWSPVSCCTFKFDPDIKLSMPKFNELSVKDKKEWVDSCPTSVFRFNDLTETVEIEDANWCMFCKECVLKAQELRKPGLVRISDTPGKFWFTIESVGVLPPERIFDDACDVMINKLDQLELALKDSFSR